MTHSPTGGSANRSDKIERARNLLLFDLSHSSAARCDRNTDLLAADQDFPAPPGLSGSFKDHALGQRLVGFDEAGRGALAGPVTVACVSFELSQWMTAAGELHESVLETYCDLNDSKRVTERNRERLYAHILAEAHCGIGCASAIEIDRLGIVKACSIAACRAYRYLLGDRQNIRTGHVPGCALKVDYGLFDRGLSLGEGEGAESIVSSVQLTHGDARSFHIAAASILAKVQRDTIMRGLEKQSAVYGFARHKGYGTAAHFEAIQKHGSSKLHRRTFLSRMGRVES